VISGWLLPSRVRVSRPATSFEDGVLTTTFEPVVGLESVPVRLEVGFYRPGKDQPLPVQAGRAPDRVATYWAAPGVDLRPGDQMEAISGPVGGVWQIRTYPDQALDMASVHHIEGQCVEALGHREDVA